MNQEDAALWAQGLDEVMERIGMRFGRVEPRRRALEYLRGLLSPVERKNGWQLAEIAGDRTQPAPAKAGRVQDFLARMHWDADLVRDDLRAGACPGESRGGRTSGRCRSGAGARRDRLPEEGRQSLPRRRPGSCGVQRQYSGTAGCIENCQIGVFLGYASRHGQALIDRALYLPQSWAADPGRRAMAGVPEPVAFATKPKLGGAMLEHAPGLRRGRLLRPACRAPGWSAIVSMAPIMRCAAVSSSTGAAMS
jgi:SRSO17 transposase